MSEEKEIPDPPLQIQSEINRALQNLISKPVTITTYSHLDKLLQLSNRLDAKLYLHKTTALPINIPAIRQVVRVNRQSSPYIKARLLEIIESMCHVKEVIEEIGQDIQLVNFILGSFDIFNIDSPIRRRFQLSLFKLLSLIICEIEDESIWKNHLTRSNYSLGSHILRILTQELSLLNFRNSLVTELLAFLELLSEVTLPDQTHILEQIFRIDDLLFPLVEWFNTVCFKYLDEGIDMFTQKYWIVVDRWVKVVSNITKLTSFEFEPSDPDNDKNRVFIVRAISIIFISFRDVLYEADDRFYVECLGNALYCAIGPMYRSISLFRSCFSRNTIYPIVTHVIVDILCRLRKDYEDHFMIENKLAIKVRRTYQIIQHLHRCYEQYVRIWSYKNMLENVLIWESCYLSRYEQDDEWPDILLIFLSHKMPRKVRCKINKLTESDKLLRFI